MYPGLDCGENGDGVGPTEMASFVSSTKAELELIRTTLEAKVGVTELDELLDAKADGATVGAALERVEKVAADALPAQKYDTERAFWVSKEELEAVKENMALAADVLEERTLVREATSDLIRLTADVAANTEKVIALRAEFDATVLATSQELSLRATLADVDSVKTMTSAHMRDISSSMSSTQDMLTSAMADIRSELDTLSSKLARTTAPSLSSLASREASRKSRVRAALKPIINGNGGECGGGGRMGSRPSLQDTMASFSSLKASILQKKTTKP